MIDLHKMTLKDRRRFLGLVIFGEPNECWGWRGAHKKKGYARFTFQGHTVAAHRVAYFIENGILEPGLEVDHLCRTLDCVNPAHLEAVTPSKNRARRVAHARLKRLHAKRVAAKTANAAQNPAQGAQKGQKGP